jgi:hypothetical protein
LSIMRVARTNSPLVVSACVLLWSFAIACTDDADNGNDDASRPMDAGGEPDRDEDAGAPDVDGGVDPRAEAVVGTATRAECTSTQAPADGMCGGYYCGVDEATLTAAIDPDALCGGDPALTCTGELVGVLGTCARNAKGAMPAATDDELRPMIEACVYEDARFEGVTTECLGCFLDATACASEHCLVECLSGDSPACDRCQNENDCTQPVFACGGLPNPF